MERTILDAIQRGKIGNSKGVRQPFNIDACAMVALSGIVRAQGQFPIVLPRTVMNHRSTLGNALGIDVLDDGGVAARHEVDELLGVTETKLGIARFALALHHLARKLLRTKNNNINIYSIIGNSIMMLKDQRAPTGTESRGSVTMAALSKIWLRRGCSGCVVMRPPAMCMMGSWRGAEGTCRTVRAVVVIRRDAVNQIGE